MLVLLIIIAYMKAYLISSPRFWSWIGHVCGRRRVYFLLYYSKSAPVSETLDRRPTLPTVVAYGESLAPDPPAPEDEDNLGGALKQSDLFIFISFTVTNSLLKRLSAIERPFSGLEGLIFQSRDSVGVTVPSAFPWGPHLFHRLPSTGVASFPALLQPLCSPRIIVELELHITLNSSHLSPGVVTQALTNALSGMVQLQSLSLHFLSDAHSLCPPPPSVERYVLPVLSHLNFWGNTEYLDDLVTRIDAPRLVHIRVTMYNIVTLNLSTLSEFIDRIGMHKSHRRAFIRSSKRAISLSLIQPGTSTYLKLQVSCKPFSKQLSFMAQIGLHFSAFLANVEDLRVSARRVGRPPSGQVDSDRKQWRGLFYQFGGTKWLHVAGDHSTNMVRALQPPDGGGEIVLPSLHKLYILHPGPSHAPSREAVVSFMASRWLSGHPITVEYGRLCRISEPHGAGTMCPSASATPR